MAVFPERMDRLDKDDAAGSLAAIENYIHYMTERIEFSAAALARKIKALEEKETEE